MPFSYCSRDAASPTEAKWPFMILPGVLMDWANDGRVGGLREDEDEDTGEAMVEMSNGNAK